MADSDSLPEGWTVQVKVRKNGRKDKYYIDPVKEYIFHSRRDVLRYCENGEVGKYVKSKDKDIADGEMESDNVSTPVAKEQSLVDSSPKTEVSQNQDSILNEAVENEKTYKSTNSKKISRDAELIKNQCKQDSVTSCPSPSESGQKGESSIQKSTDDKREKIENGDHKPGLVGKLKCRKLTELPRRSSKRLAGLQIDQPPEIKTKTRAGPVLASHLAEVEGSFGGNLEDLVVKKADSEDITNQMRSEFPKKDPNSPCLESQLPEMISHIKEISASEGSAGNIETEDTTKKLERNREKQTDLPRRASKRIAGIDIGPQMEQKATTRARRVSSEPLIEEKVPAPINLSIPGNDKTVEESGLPSEPLLDDIWMDPCFDFAVKTLTDVIPVEDHLKAPDPSSSKCLWEDPCIQFAVKTLTGDIPLVVDFGVEEYIRKKMTKNQTSVHSDSNSFLDSMEKNLPKKPDMNHSRNGSMQTPVNNKIN